MQNVIDNIIAGIFVSGLSTVVGLIVKAVGYSNELAVTIALVSLVILYIGVSKYHPTWTRLVTMWMLEKALQVGEKEDDSTRISFRYNIIKRILREREADDLKEKRLTKRFPNQDTCITDIRHAFSESKKVKILTVRASRYFLGSNSIFYDSLKMDSGAIANADIQVMVLSPYSNHITEALAGKLNHSSAEEIREKMMLSLRNLRMLARRFNNFHVKYYDGTPNWKILMFDDVMFVSCFTSPKNDANVEMFQLIRDSDNVLFIGLERYFDDLWSRSVTVNDSTVSD